MKTLLDLLKFLLYIGLWAVPVATSTLIVWSKLWCDWIASGFKTGVAQNPYFPICTAGLPQKSVANFEQVQAFAQALQAWGHQNWLELTIIVILSWFILYFFWQAKKSLKCMGHASSDMDKLRSVLMELEKIETKDDLDNITKQIEVQFKKMHRLWKEFRESIIFESGEQNQGTATSRVIVGNSKRPQAFFNQSDMALQYNVDLHSVNGFNGKAIGLGMLGTFFGLTVGIAGLSITNIGNADINQLMDSIFKLLAGAGLAFSSSLYGIFSSLVFSSLRKEYFIKFDRNLYQLNDRLEEKFDLVTQEQELKNHGQILNQNSAILNKQLELLRAIDENLNERLDGLGNKMVEAFKVEIRKLSEVIANSGSQMMDKALGESTTKIERVVNGLLQATETTNSTIARLAASTDEMQQKFSQQQQGINESVAQSLSGFQGSVTEAGTTLQNLLRDVTENLRLQQERLTQYSRENIEKSMQGIQQARELLAQSTTEFARIMEGMTKKQEHDQLVLKQILEVQNNSGHHMQQLTDASNKIEHNIKSLHQLPKQIEGAMNQLQGVNQHIENVYQKYDNIYQQYGQNLEALRSKLQHDFDEAFSQITQEYENSFEAITQKCKQNFDGIDEAAAKAAKELTQGVEGSIEKMHKQLRDIQESLDRVCQNFSGVAKDTRESVDLIQESIDNLKNK